MNKNLYETLRDKVGLYSAYFPKSVSGVELNFLKKLFDEEEADMYIHLSNELETPEQISARSGKILHEIVPILERMAKKGLLFPKHKDDKIYYVAAPFAHGILENQIHTVDQELAQIYEDYIWAEKVPEERRPEDANEPLVPLRSIPVQQPVNISRPIAPYESVKEIIMNQDRIAVTECFCAKQQQKLGSDCDQPMEVCLMLGFYADYYEEYGFGRKIDQQEALEILDIAEEAGLVHQIPNSKDPGAICNCCPDCCGGLRFLKKLPSPALLITTNHYVQVNSHECNSCGKCIKRCSMDAINLTKEDTVEINRNRCIGCGLCISTCPKSALTLMSKPDTERSEPPETLKFMRSSQDIEASLKD